MTDNSTDKPKNLGSIPSIKPDRDEVASYRRGTRSEVPKQSNFNGMLVFSLIIMAIMISVGGYTLYEVQKQLDHSNDLLAKSMENLKGLENELALTGTKSSKTFSSMETELKSNFSEIDKLWAVAYRQNKPKIAELENEMNRANVESTKIKSTVNKLNTDFGVLSENFTEDNASMMTQVSMVRGQVQDQADIQENTSRIISSLSRKVGEIEEAVEAFDQYRRQVNKKLLELQGQAGAETESETEIDAGPIN